MQTYKEMIEDAYQHVYQAARKTPLDIMPLLSDRQENNIWLKREDKQPIFSYKLRGAYNIMRHLSAHDKRNGIIAASAGNHAQGIAFSGQKLGIKTLIVMPKTTPEIKVSAVTRLGAKIILHGINYDEAKNHAIELSKQQGKTYITPYDHPLIIAGQATVAIEILQQHPTKPDIIFVPIGGGGLIAGIVAHLQEAAPEICIIGVEPDEAPCMHNALVAGERVILERIGIFADGAAVRQAGEEPFRIIKDVVNEIILTNVDEICAAVKDIFEDTRSIPEPAGALALAGMKKYIERTNIKNKELVVICSGANVNFDRLRHIAELSALGEHKEALISTKLPEKPGSFLNYCRDLGSRQITEFNYRYSDPNTAYVFAGLQLKDGIEEKNTLLQSLREKHYEIVDLSNDELAKMHVRYMVGGHTHNLKNELLYRFEFPEYQGALLQFLTQIGKRWNISLFHYRNHGAAYGRVLMGIQVTQQERAEFQIFLDQLGMRYWDETDNPTYQMFLS